MEFPPALVALQPEAIGHLEHALQLAAEEVEPDILRPVQARIAQLLGYTGFGPVGDTSDPRLTAAISLAEQMILDVSSVTDEQVEACTAILPPGGAANLISAIYITEASIRLTMCSALLLETP